jgi:hypothetical protein
MKISRGICARYPGTKSRADYELDLSPKWNLIDPRSVLKHLLGLTQVDEMLILDESSLKRRQC